MWYDNEWNLALATIDNSEESIDILRWSINFFLERKHLKAWDENYEYVKNNFEKNFPWVNYDMLWKTLFDIIDNNRVFTYSTQEENDFEWLWGEIKEVSLGETRWKYFVYFDRDNNTIEYRLLRKITWFNEWFKPLSKRPSRLYLESQNQYPRVPRVENARDWYVPTVNYFWEIVRDLLLIKESKIKSIRDRKLSDYYHSMRIRNNDKVSMSEADKKRIVFELLENKEYSLYTPWKMEDIRYKQNGIWLNLEAYRHVWRLIENKNGYLLLDNFEVINHNWKQIELRLWFFLNLIDNGSPQTYVESKNIIAEL